MTTKNEWLPYKTVLNMNMLRKIEEIHYFRCHWRPFTQHKHRFTFINHISNERCDWPCALNELSSAKRKIADRKRKKKNKTQFKSSRRRTLFLLYCRKRHNWSNSNSMLNAQPSRCLDRWPCAKSMLNQIHCCFFPELRVWRHYHSQWRGKRFH